MPFSDDTSDVLDDATQIRQDVAIPVAKHDKTGFVQHLGSPHIRSSSGFSIVLAAVDFDRELYGRAIEVEDAIANRMLTPKLQVLDLSAAQGFPEFGLRIRHVSTKLSGALGHRSRAREA